MELLEVVHRRRMTRSYTDEPVDRQVIEDMLAAAVRAPSAGFSQGWAFLVLDTHRDVGRYWAATTGSDSAPDAWLTGMRRAPVLIVALSCKEAYLSRYAEDDKARQNPGWRDRAELRWPVPYWHMDTAMAVVLMLLVAEDAGLGACFFGVPGESTAAVRASFGVPADHVPVGVVSVGHRGPPLAAGSPSRRARRPLGDVVHRGHWLG
jgi:nitroreductase